MNYWLTTHWPPRSEGVDAPLGVWLENGKIEAAHGMEIGDLLLVYQTASGPSVREIYADQSQRVISRLAGRQGIVKLATIVDRPSEREECGIETYADGQRRWWRYLAPAAVINSAGYVPRTEVARAIGYSTDYVFRGFGKAQSGLMQLTESQFHQLRVLFQSHSDAPDDAIKQRVERSGGFGPGGEGADHLALKLAIAKNPSRLLGEEALSLWQLEYLLPTADKVDVVLKDRFGRFVAVEVEVECSDTEIIGPLQCMKYRALLSFLHKREVNEVRTMLVAHSIHRAVSADCKRFGIECRVVHRQCLSPSVA